jgi:hypothetical protein
VNMVVGGVFMYVVASWAYMLSYMACILNGCQFSRIKGVICESI